MAPDGPPRFSRFVVRAQLQASRPMLFAGSRTHVHSSDRAPGLAVPAFPPPPALPLHSHTQQYTAVPVGVGFRFQPRSSGMLVHYAGGAGPDHCFIVAPRDSLCGTVGRHYSVLIRALPNTELACVCSCQPVEERQQWLSTTSNPLSSDQMLCEAPGPLISSRASPAALLRRGWRGKRYVCAEACFRALHTYPGRLCCLCQP